MKLSSWFKKGSGLMVGLLVGVLVACGGSSVADSNSNDLTQAQVQTMIASAVTPLQSQIADLQSQVQALQAKSGSSQAAVFIRAPNAAMARQTRTIGGSLASTRGLPAPCNWTLTGRPTTSDPIGGNTYAGVSCTGYYFLITGSVAGGLSGVMRSANIGIGWDGPGCTGNAYVTSGVSPGATVNGFVFAVNVANPAYVGPDTNPADYYYVPAASQPVTVTIASYFQDGRGCLSGGALANAYAALPNDESVTGIPSAPIPGPVLISN